LQIRLGIEDLRIAALQLRLAELQVSLFGLEVLWQQQEQQRRLVVLGGGYAVAIGTVRLDKVRHFMEGVQHVLRVVVAKLPLRVLAHDPKCLGFATLLIGVFGHAAKRKASFHIKLY